MKQLLQNGCCGAFPALTILAALAVLLGASPASAQQRLILVRTAPQFITQLTAQFRSVPESGLLSSEVTPIERHAEDTSISAFDTVETPFVEHYALAFGQVWHGRLRFVGFGNLYSMEDVLWGPPAAGDLPAWGVTAQNHVAVSSPMQAPTIGFSVSIHRGTAGEVFGAFLPKQWLSRFARDARG